MPDLLYFSALLWYATVGLCVALWRVAWKGLAICAGAVVAWRFEREMEESAK